MRQEEIREGDMPVESPLVFSTGGHAYGVIGGDEVIRRFREGAEE